jgi:hypothetical protein
VVDPSPDELIAFGVNKTYSFSHNILDEGYNALTDSITSSSLVFSFLDESTDAAAESVFFTFDLSSFGSQLITSGGATFTSEFSGLTLNGLLASDGTLNVELENAGTTNGHQEDRSDFLFLGSTLTVNVDRATRAGFISTDGDWASRAGMGLAQKSGISRTDFFLRWVYFLMIGADKNGASFTRPDL